MKRLFIALFLTTLCLSMKAQGNGTYVIELEEAGTLLDKIGMTNIYSVTDLTVSGPVNGLDFQAISKMKSLVSIDLKNSNIVAGGTTKPYITTANSVSNLFNEAPVQHIILPNSATTIMSSAFRGNTNIRSILIGDLVTSVPDYAFKSCTNLRSVVLGQAVNNIDYQAFEECINLETINLTTSIEVKGASFRNCKRLKGPIGFKVSWGNGSQGMFTGCESLDQVTVSTDGDLTMVFYGCTNLKTVEIKGTPYRMSSTFADCTSLESVNLPANTQYVSEVFRGCSSLKTVVLPTKITELDGTFIDCTSLKSIEIPASVKTLDNTFNGCTSLSDQVIPETVTKVTNSAFANTGITSITIPNSITGIGTKVFQNCRKLETVVFHDKMNAISNYAFSGCTNLTEMSLPNSVTIINPYAFENCTKLRKLSPGSAVTEIGNYAFQNCTGLSEFEFPGSLTKIGSYTFQNCIKLQNLVLPSKLASIGSYAFLNCTGLNEVSISPSVTSLGACAFNGCKGLTSLRFEDSIYDLSMQSYKLNNTVTYPVFPQTCQSVYIGRNISFTAPSATYSILNPLENSDSLIYVTLGEIVSDCPSFKGSGKIEKVTCKGTSLIPSVKATDFDAYTYSFAILNVPAGYLNAYQSHEYWSKFKNITVEGTVYTLTYLLDGKPYETFRYEAGAHLTSLASPAKEGYVFSGWSEVPYMMPAEDVTVTGTFTSLPSGITGTEQDITEVARYTTEGVRITKPAQGINIVVYSNGTVKREVVTK